MLLLILITVCVTLNTDNSLCYSKMSHGRLYFNVGEGCNNLFRDDTSDDILRLLIVTKYRNIVICVFDLVLSNHQSCLDGLYLFLKMSSMAVMVSSGIGLIACSISQCFPCKQNQEDNESDK